MMGNDIEGSLRPSRARSRVVKNRAMISRWRAEKRYTVNTKEAQDTVQRGEVRMRANRTEERKRNRHDAHRRSHIVVPTHRWLVMQPILPPSFLHSHWLGPLLEGGRASEFKRLARHGTCPLPQEARVSHWTQSEGAGLWRGVGQQQSEAGRFAMLLGAFQRVVPLGWVCGRVRHGMPLRRAETAEGSC